MHELVARYVPLVPFLAQVLGPATEVVLHDLENPENSIVAIANGAVSGRAIGGPVTDMLLKVIHDGDREAFMTNYRGVGKEGKTTRSSSFFIREREDGRLLGVLCVNTDISAAIDLQRQLEAFLAFDPDSPGPALPEATEHLHESVDDLLSSMINTILSNAPNPAKGLGPAEKAELIRRLNETGVFLLKGSISEVAARLKISEASVYRYISKAKADQSLS